MCVGRWGTMAEWGDPGALWSQSWNATVPTPHGTAPNNIMPVIWPQQGVHCTHTTQCMFV